MNRFYSFSIKLLTVCLVLFSVRAEAQLAVTPSNNAVDLANQIVGAGVTISNAQLNCGEDGSGIFSNGGSTNIGIQDGILLTTGLAADAIGPNDDGDLGTSTFNGGDPDLQALIPQTINDACVLNFDFIAESNVLSVQYVFGSEEYHEFANSSFNDVFAFFVSGPNPAGGNYVNQNVALLPNSNIPVSINNVNNGSSNTGPCTNCEYLVNNIGGLTIQYDAFTVVLTASVEIIPGETYAFKFAIADAGDRILDSGVFIKGSSFTVFPEDPTVSIECPENLFVDCTADLAPEVLNSLPTINVDGLTGSSSADVTYMDNVILEGECQYVIARTWMVQVGDFVEMCTQTITVSDFTGPEFIDFPSDILVSCVEEVSGPEMVSAEDACNSVTEVEIFTSETGAPIEECIASTAFGPGAD
ncbi:MAG: choice-of-anchor L domain-containing protein, partial [Flavobacteriales bacterium]